MLEVSAEVGAAIGAGRPVIALETSIVGQGLPTPHNLKAARGCVAESGAAPAERIHVIPHGAFDYLLGLPDERPLPAELASVEGPVVLCF